MPYTDEVRLAEEQQAARLLAEQNLCQHVRVAIEIPKPYADNDTAIEIGELTKQRDHYKALLEWLGDFRNKFHYSVYENGQVMVKHPGGALCPNLISAIEYAKDFQTKYPRMAGIE